MEAWSQCPWDVLSLTPSYPVGTPCISQDHSTWILGRMGSPVCVYVWYVCMWVCVCMCMCMCECVCVWECMWVYMSMCRIREYVSYIRYKIYLALTSSQSPSSTPCGVCVCVMVRWCVGEFVNLCIGVLVYTKTDRHICIQTDMHKDRHAYRHSHTHIHTYLSPALI